MQSRTMSLIEALANILVHFYAAIWHIRGLGQVFGRHIKLAETADDFGQIGIARL